MFEFVWFEYYGFVNRVEKIKSGMSLGKIRF